jgi:hypothetical protein
VLGSVPSRLLIAKLAIPPTKPLPVESSDVGDWAPSVRTASTGFDHPAKVTIHGKASGTATITYTGNILSSADSVTYSHYSDDGTTFADGTEAIDNPQLLTTPVSLSANISITGAHHGFFHANMTAGEGAGQTPGGTVESELDGAHRSGLPQPGACPRSMPHPSHVTVRTVGRRRGTRARLSVYVTASIGGAGMNELERDVRPIAHATVVIDGRRLTTGPHGTATALLPIARRYRVRVSAGATFTLAQTTVGIAG